jgi:quinol-cytochrome oxidoreductase complex cytochrome b subunit
MEERKQRKPTFYPDQFFTEMVIFLFIIGVVVSLSVLLPIGYEEEANPLVTPSTINPEWYFLWLFQVMKLVPPTIGVLVPFVISGILILLPFIDTREISTFREHRWFILGGTAVLILIFVLSIWATLGE